VGILRFRRNGLSLILTVLFVLTAGGDVIYGGVLAGRHIVISPGHGWQWNPNDLATTLDWYTERTAQQLGLIEDFNNHCIARHVKAYLDDASALTHTVRDMNPGTMELIYTGQGPNTAIVTKPCHYPRWQVGTRYYFHGNFYGENVPAAVYDPAYGTGTEKNKCLRSRTYYANWLRKQYNKCDLYLGIHSNASSTQPAPRGTVVLCDNDNNSNSASDYDGGDFSEHTLNITNSYNFAKKLAAQVVAMLKTYYDPTWAPIYNAYGVWQADYKWWETRGVQKPSATIEYGFHTSVDDSRALLDEKARRLMALGAYKGICDYFGVTDYDLPSVVTDLRVYPGNGVGQVRITWTAPGEDGTYQPAKLYVLKYSTASIDSTVKFTAAKTYTQSWLPKKRYSREEYVLSNLLAGVTYYFCLQSKNDTNDTSKISNCTSVAAQAVAGANVPVGTVKGKVVDLVTKMPVVAAELLVSPENIGVTPGVDGGYAVSGLSEGENTVTVTAQGYITVSSTTWVVAGATVSINFELLLSTYATLTGIVRDKSSGAGIYNARVQLAGTGNVSVNTDINGWYGVGRLATGAYYLTISCDGYQSGSQIVTLSAGNETAVNMQLTPLGAGVSKGVVTGTVKIAGTSGYISGAACTLYPEIITVVTDGAGIYRFGNIVVGSHTVTVVYGGYQTLASTCALVSGATVYLDFGLSAGNTQSGGRLFGVVSAGSEDVIISGAVCTLQPGNYGTTSMDDGSYVFTGLSTGTYVLSVSKTGYRASAETVVMNEYIMEFNVTLVQQRSSVISGRVFNKNTGNGAGGLIVNAVKGNTARTVVTDEDGRYRIENISEAGYWTLTVGSVGYKEVSSNLYVSISGELFQNFELVPFESLENIVISAKVFTPVDTNGSKKSLRISFSSDTGDTVNAKVVVYDIRGRVVKELEKDSSSAEVNALWDGTDNSGREVSSGVYFYQIEAGGKVRNGKVVVAK